MKSLKWFIEVNEESYEYDLYVLSSIIIWSSSNIKLKDTSLFVVPKFPIYPN